MTDPRLTGVHASQPIPTNGTVPIRRSDCPDCGAPRYFGGSSPPIRFQAVTRSKWRPV